MKKKLTLILSVACALFCCLGFTACKKDTKIEGLEKRGYTISVSYDANGGEYLNRPGITVMDMFNPKNFKTDTNGEIHIRLKEPTDPSRPTSSSTSITLKKDGYFFAGWYEQRTVKTVDGVPVDENGRALVLTSEGTYEYATPTTDEQGIAVTPAYEYDGYWDFSKTWDIKPTEIKGTLSKTLYAGWVKYYEFNYYYYQEDNTATAQDESGWTLFGSNSFDYKTTNAEGSKTADKDTIWLPDWKNGAMNHDYAYANESVYTFPKLNGMTFSKAYLDQDCTQEITTASFEHRGTLDYAHAVAQNRVENIYVVFEKGDYYKIETAKQLQDNFNLNGNYEIKADLDFTGFAWPLGFTKGSFTGKMYATEGQTFAISNVSVKYAVSSNAVYGGLFGEICDGAEVKNLSFENVTFDMATAQLANDSSFGLFAGVIQDNAIVQGVSVGGLFKIGAVTSRFENYNFHLLVGNGNVDGITETAVTLQVYGTILPAVNGVVKYRYFVKDVSIETNGAINLTISELTGDNATYDVIK